MLTGKPLLILWILTLAISAGCATRPSMEELELEAMRTGDWSSVEKRERMDRRMGLVNPDNTCHDDAILLCSKKGAREQCDCVTPNVVRPQ